ncbi:hypothetical protein [Sedimentitalea nanhaiensis]|uniref:Uncharacterized protein n=1 Tax=Sedimentitalea nanhaiensis TaxID=999627 RepID=A0A1I7CP67_9RHOB|nr:hypothetical protein [Sedimentitalea nanhaiensis]SFU01211.1 hypothetical protein SAMN05216236_11854 [Sedimentitalea nanhaiensis]
MLFLLIPLGIGLLFWVYLSRRGSSLTRNCRWRADRAAGPGRYSCASCGGQTRTDNGTPPRHCVARVPRNSD